MKLSAILAPLIAAKVPHEVILDTVRAYEAENDDALERRRASDRERQSRRRNGMSRDTSVTERDKEVSPHTPLQEKQSPPSPPKGGSSPTKLGTRLPDDFEPEMQAATAEGLSTPEAQREADKFRDYWRAQPGQKGRKTDWPATWRNWCRRASEDRAKARGSPPKPQSVGDMFASEARRMMNGYHDEPTNKPDRHITQGDAGRHDGRVGKLIDASVKSGW